MKLFHTLEQKQYYQSKNSSDASDARFFVDFISRYASISLDMHTITVMGKGEFGSFVSHQETFDFLISRGWKKKGAGVSGFEFFLKKTDGITLFANIVISQGKTEDVSLLPRIDDVSVPRNLFIEEELPVEIPKKPIGIEPSHIGIVFSNSLTRRSS